MECEYIKSNGKKCIAQTIKGDKFCFAHSSKPIIIEKRNNAKSLGGKNGRKQMLTPSKTIISLKNPNDPLTLLEQTINDVGKIN